MLVRIVPVLSVLVLRHLLAVYITIYIHVLAVHGALVLSVGVMPRLLDSLLARLVIYVIVVRHFLWECVIVFHRYIAVRRRHPLIRRLGVMVCTVRLWVSTRIFGARVTCRWVVVALVSR